MFCHCFNIILSFFLTESTVILLFLLTSGQHLQWKTTILLSNPLPPITLAPGNQEMLLLLDHTKQHLERCDLFKFWTLKPYSTFLRITDVIIPNNI